MTIREAACREWPFVWPRREEGREFQIGPRCPTRTLWRTLGMVWFVWWPSWQRRPPSAFRKLRKPGNDLQ